jgi:N-acetylglucosamine-6-phosphate deacetylase
MIAWQTASLFDGTSFAGPATVLVDDAGYVSAVVDTPPPGVALAATPPGTTLTPGFVDLQVNGGGGVLFNDAITVDGLRRIAAAHAALGTTSILATLITSPRPHIAAALGAVAAARAQAVPGILGAHIEGPFISPKRPGIHPPEFIATMTESDAAMLSAPRDGVRLVTLAPEKVAPAHVARLLDAGVRVFAGHTEATAEQATAAFAQGVHGVTHLFNAMSQFGSRAPGMVGATLGDDAAAAGIIVDLLHVARAAVRAAYRALGPDRLFLVSDSMPTSGSDVDHFTLAGRLIRLVDGRLADAAGTLGGAQICMAQAVRNAVALCAIPVSDALKMATSTPARWAGVDHVGRIAPGCRADFVALDTELNVVRVWQGGVAVPMS